MVLNMEVGQKVQAIIPASLAYGDKGVCIENGECLIKPGSTLGKDIDRLNTIQLVQVCKTDLDFFSQMIILCLFVEMNSPSL